MDLNAWELLIAVQRYKIESNSQPRNKLAADKTMAIKDFCRYYAVFFVSVQLNYIR